MNSVGTTRRKRGRHVPRGGTSVRMLTAMLLVALALPLGTIGSAYGEESAAEAESLSQTAAEDPAATSEEATDEGTSTPSDQAPESTDAGDDPAAGSTAGNGDDAAGASATESPTDPTTDPAAEPGGDPSGSRQADLLAAAAEPEPLELVAPITATGGFEIDGDTAVNNGGKDWDTTGTRIVDGAGDGTVYTSGDELTDPREWTDTANASAPGNDDIVAAYSHTEMVDGQLWVFFGFERAAASGTSNYVIEYNRLGNWSNDPAQPHRSPGDLRIRVVQGGNGDFAVAGVERWSLTDGVGCTAVTAKDKTVVGYWCPAPDATPFFKGVSSEDKVFAEGALNLSGLLGGADNCLGGYGVVNMRSFSGGSTASQLKDYVAGTPVTVPSTCGSLDILKVDQFGDPVPGATFTVAPNPAPGGGTGPLTVTDGGTGDPDGTADGTVSIDPAKPGAYTVTETGVPAGYLPPDDDTQEAVVPQNGSDSVTFVNDKTFAPLTATNAAAATFDVTHDWRLAKSVDAPRVETPEGTPARADYTVTLEALPEQRDGYEVHGTLTITNPNQDPVTATLEAGLTGGVACDVDAADTSGADGHQVEVGPGTHGFTYTCQVAGTPAADGTSTATVAWDADRYPPVPGTDPGNPATAPDDYTYTVDEVTDEEATVTDSFDGGTPEELGTFTWSEVWASTDPAAHTVEVPTDPRVIDGVPGTCTPYDNTATAVEGDSGQERTDTATVEVCVGRDLDVDKTVGVSWTRAYGWDLAKAGPATVFVGDDGQGSATYDITVTATQPMDTGVTVGGTITITNPNDWDMVADVTDRFTLRGVDYPCTVTGGDDVTVPGDDSVVLGYTCDLSSLPGDVWPDGYDGANEVTVTWDQEEYFTPGDDVVFTNHVDAPEEQTETPAFDTITLADEITEAGGAPVTVDLGDAGDLTWTDVRESEDHQVTIPVTVPLDTSLAADECTTYTNVVSAPGVPVDPAQARTEVCRPEITKTVDAGFERTYEWLVDKSVDETEVEIAEGGDATFTYTVTVTPDGFEDGGASFDGVITLSNPSASAELAAVVADQDDVPGWTCAVAAEDADVTVAPGRSVDVGYTCVPETDAHPSGDNTATATFGGSTVSVTEDVAFAEEVSTDDTIEVTDPKAPGGVVGTFDWSDGEQSASYTWTTSGEPGVCTPYGNTATITSTGQTASEWVEVCVEAPLEVSKTAAGSFDRDYEWTLEKVSTDPEAAIAEGGTRRFPYRVTATPDGYVDSGFEVGGEITVTNPNEYAAGGISATVSDELSGITGAQCTVVDPQVQLAPGASATLDYSCSLTPTAADYVGENVATATWTPAERSFPAQEGDPTTASAHSDPVPVSLAVDEVSDFAVEVVDDPQGPEGPDVLGTATWGAEPGTATASEASVFEYDGPVREGVPGECTPYSNTASIEQAVGSDLEATASVELCVGRDLQVDKSVGVAYDRTYHWDLDKTGPGTVFVGDDGAASATYDITVTAGRPTDDDVVVSGTIRVTNPNDWAMVADVSDTFTLRGVETVCTVGGGDDVTVPGDTTVELGYTCEVPAATWPDGYDGVNEVEATWDQEEYATPSASATFTNPVDEPEEVTERPAFATVELADLLAEDGRPGEEVDLGDAGSLAWADVWAAADHQVTLPVTVDLATDLDAGQCTSFTNTVSIPDTAVTDDATTEVCRPLVDKTADASFGRTRLWSVDKAVDPARVEIAQGGEATYTYTVTATPTEVVDDGTADWDGAVTVTNPSRSADLIVDVTDVVGVDGWTCTFVSSGEDTATDVVVAAGDTEELAYTCSGAGHPDGDNTVHVDFGDERVTDVEPVSFEARKSVGDSTVEVLDDMTGDEAQVLFTADAADQSSWTHTYELTQTGSPGVCTTYDNTAWIDLAGGRENPSDDASVELCVEAPLEVSKRAAGSFDRDYEWTLEKVSTEPTAEVDEGGSHRFPYRVTATPEGYADSGFEVGGEITVTNPNEYAAGGVSATVSDELSGITGAQCAVADPQVQLAPGASATLDYSCSLAPTAGDYDGENVATATWTPAERSFPAQAGDPTSASAESDPVPVSLAVDEVTDFTVEVVDDPQGPEGPDVLGTATWGAEPGTATPGAASVFEYDGPVREGVPGQCTPYSNTASIDQAVGSDLETTAQVELCVIEVLGTETPEPPGPPAPPAPPTPGTPDVEVKGTEATLPDTGAPEGLVQLGVLGLLTTLTGLVLLWHSRRQRRREAS